MNSLEKRRRRMEEREEAKKKVKKSIRLSKMKKIGDSLNYDLQIIQSDLAECFYSALKE